MKNWWYKRPRIVNIIVDNDSWILPYAHHLVEKCISQGEHGYFFKNHDDLTEADISFYLGCIRITPPNILLKSKKNIVVHASDLPRGRGFSPLTWQILEGKNNIPVCLLEMAKEVDAGDIVFYDELKFEGHELIGELRDQLGKKTIELCLRYLNSSEIPEGKKQEGQPTFYSRRKQVNSQLTPTKTINELFNHLRVVDNDRYPAFFEKNGQTYILKIFKKEL